MVDIGTVDVNAPAGEKSGPSPMLIVGGIGAVVGVMYLLTRRASGGSTAIAPMSSANIAFSSLENSLLNFQGLYTANTAAYNQRQTQISEQLTSMNNERRSEWAQTYPSLVQIQQDVGSNSYIASYFQQIFNLLGYWQRHYMPLLPPADNEGIEGQQ